MCTLTFCPTPEGLIIGMNRDEQKSRILAQPPKKHDLKEDFSCLAPSEPNGGMWIAVGQNGNIFALLNWYSIKPLIPGPFESRGKIIPSLLPLNTVKKTELALNCIAEKRFRPFRLITFFSNTQQIVEWQSNGEKTIKLDHSWRTRLWASSGFDEPDAQKTRIRTWEIWLGENSYSQPGGLEKFHQSHSPEKGANSVCMHREDAQTVSYTEVEVKNSNCSVRYIAGSPCCKNEEFTMNMSLTSGT